MNFVPADGSEAQKNMIEEMDQLVQTLVHADMRGRRAAVSGDPEEGMAVSMIVTQAIGELTWGAIPTVIMHFAGHVGMACQEAVRMAATLEASADGLTRVSQILSENGAPVDMCAQLMDLAVEMRTSAEACLYEPSDCGDEGEECNHG